MTRSDTLGEFELMVLLAIAHLADGAYGVTIRREIEQRAGRIVSVGALYTALDRLERKGFLTSALSDPTPERGGRAKRVVTLTAAGAAALRRSRDVMARMWAGLPDSRLRAPRSGRLQPAKRS